MKQRKAFIDKVYLQHPKAIVIILSIVFFVSGYWLTASTLTKPITNSEFEFYEQVARDVYEQGNKAIYEVPNGVLLVKTNTSITISNDGIRRGQVVATLQNGELVCTRDLQTAYAIIVNSLCGIIFSMPGTIFVKEKMRKRS